jgi:hypothetical protein
MDMEDRIEHQLDEIRRLRDELRLQVHLGAAEVKDLWAESEEKFEAAEAKALEFKKQSEQPLENVRDAAKLLLDEIHDGYKRIRAAL